MDIHHLKLGALNTKTNKYTRPNEADKISEYKCIECSEKVIFKKGAIRIPHFSHYAHSNCTYYDHPNESQIHKDAKLKIRELLQNGNTLQFNNFCRKCKRNVDKKIKCKEDEDVVLEFRDISGQWIADVAVVDQDKKSKFIIEIKNTHLTQTERPEPWVEVEAKDVIEFNNNLFKNIREYICNRCEEIEIINKQKEQEKIELETQKEKERIDRIEKNRKLKLGAFNKLNNYILPNNAKENEEYFCIRCLENVFFSKELCVFEHCRKNNICKYFQSESNEKIDEKNKNGFLEISTNEYIDIYEYIEDKKYKCIDCKKHVYPDSGLYHYLYDKCNYYHNSTKRQNILNFKYRLQKMWNNSKDKLEISLFTNCCQFPSKNEEGDLCNEYINLGKYYNNEYKIFLNENELNNFDIILSKIDANCYIELLFKKDSGNDIYDDYRDEFDNNFNKQVEFENRNFFQINQDDIDYDCSFPLQFEVLTNEPDYCLCEKCKLIIRKSIELRYSIKNKNSKYEWVLNSETIYNKLQWFNFISLKSCMRCHLYHETSYLKPFCKGCYSIIKKEQHIREIQKNNQIKQEEEKQRLNKILEEERQKLNKKLEEEKQKLDKLNKQKEQDDLIKTKNLELLKEIKDCNYLLKYAIEYGYYRKISDEPPYRFYCQQLLDEALKGNYLSQYRWVSKSNLVYSFIPKIDRHEYVCFKCNKQSNSIPYCLQCENLVKIREDEKSTIKSSRMLELREQLSFLKDVPGGWKAGENCYFCDKNYDDKLDDDITTYTWWFAERKKICTYCFDQACRIKKIY